MKHFFDVIVIGGGHAGCEAAYASARYGAKTVLITKSLENLGEMSCNPAIGGLGKGHLVREIDALGGVMGIAADQSGIQFRLLNRSKGPAVRGPRTQSDRVLYKAAVRSIMLAKKNLTIIEGIVVDFEIKSSRIVGVTCENRKSFDCSSVVLTTGTFLSGVLHIGEKSYPGGRLGESPSNNLSKKLYAMGLEMGRLKTGTPPRLDGRTIDWSLLGRQEADKTPEFFSFMTDKARQNQISCGVTYTNLQTHKIIKQNIHRSPIYNGKIDGLGPRYCPSIEDKIVRFEEKECHQVFLEPEGLSTNIVYPNGISTSLPQEIQEIYVRSIKGLKDVKITQPGYAVEYDFVDPRSLKFNLELKCLERLFLAGQINGTTGYEEAAAQGLFAGLNAARAAFGEQPVHIDRAQAYIGVLIDDLITRGVSEPYRMFTSRAEYRLLLRADNADQRLTPLGIDLDIICVQRRKTFKEKMNRLKEAQSLTKKMKLTSSQAVKYGLKVKQNGQIRSAYELLSYEDVDMMELSRIWPSFSKFEPEICNQLSYDARYSVYLERQKRDVESMRKDAEYRIPEEFSYSDIPNLSTEIREKLEKIRPNSLAHASRIDGITPVAITLILAKLKKKEQRRSVL